jgi:hypothetical protein
MAYVICFFHARLLCVKLDIQGQSLIFEGDEGLILCKSTMVGRESKRKRKKMREK